MAQYYREAHNRARSELRKKGKDELLDVQFLIFRQRRMLDAAATANAKVGVGAAHVARTLMALTCARGTVQDVVEYLAFKQHSTNASKYDEEATTALVRFWGELMHRTPSAQRLQDCARQMSVAVQSATESCAYPPPPLWRGAEPVADSISLARVTDGALMKHPTVQTLRTFASFLSDIQNDSSRGEAC